MLRAARVPHAVSSPAGLPAGLLASLLASLWLAGCAVSSATVVTDAAPDSIDQAALLASACSGCHHVNGTAIVDLRSQSAAQIEQSLRAYRQAADGPTAMHRMARGYTDAEITAIARRLGR